MKLKLLYVKTEGPVPAGVNLIVGKLYEVEDVTKLTFLIVDEDGFGIRTCINKPCTATMCNIPWTFCDASGTPVPAPWESKKKECKCSLRTALVGDGCAVCNPELAAEYALESAQEDAAIYRAHAEKLAAIGAKVAANYADEVKYWDAEFRPEGEALLEEFGSALAAYNQAKGEA